MEKRARAVEIGNRLRELRGIRPRTKVAALMGISYSALCKFETGDRIPNDDMKQRIADFYGKSVQQLFFS